MEEDVSHSPQADVCGEKFSKFASEIVQLFIGVFLQAV